MAPYKCDYDYDYGYEPIEMLFGRLTDSRGSNEPV